MKKRGQCSMCKGRRLEGSDLCAKCLILQVKGQAKLIKRMTAKIDRCIKMYANEMQTTEELLKHGFEQNRRISGLFGKIRELMDDRKGARNYG